MLDRHSIQQTTLKRLFELIVEESRLEHLTFSGQFSAVFQPHRSRTDPSSSVLDWPGSLPQLYG